MLNQRDAKSTPATPSVESAPWWVKKVLFGVPDRRTAMVFYWMFVAGLFAAPLLTLDMIPGFRISKLTALVMIGFCTFALWSTSRAVSWLDEHGWRSLTHKD